MQSQGSESGTDVIYSIHLWLISARLRYGPLSGGGGEEYEDDLI